MNQLFQFEYKLLQGSNQLSTDHKALVEAAKKSQNCAYAPYSEFTVGAAVLLDNNVVVVGSNQENAAYPSGLCAERVAMFYALSAHPNAIVKSIAIFAGNEKFPLKMPISPCGACRQCLIEYELRQRVPMEIILSADCENIVVIPSAKCLLPLHFEEVRLRK